MTEGKAARATGYRPLCKLASGGMGSVHLVVREEGAFRRLYALKRLHPHLVADTELRAMFLEEARLAGLLRHQNAVSVLDVGEDAEGPFTVMDYVEGVSVAALLAKLEERDEQLPLTIAVDICRQASLGLHAAHEVRGHDGKSLNLVHRDVSPQNLIVGYDGIVRVTDFGVAKALGQSSQTAMGVWKGKMGYMSPEQLTFGEPDRRSDLFSLGVVLFEMVTGTRLYKSEEGNDGRKRALDDPPPDLMDYRDVPPGLVDLAFGLLAKKPEDRPQSAQETADRLAIVRNELDQDEDEEVNLGAYVDRLFVEERARVRHQIETSMPQSAVPVGSDGGEARSDRQGLTGKMLGPYRMEEKIGAGGMGEVWRASDTRLDRTVAIKILPNTRASNEGGRQRFEREARAIAQLSHPHICTLHDVGREGTIDYLVMEYLHGVTVAERLEGKTGSSRSALSGLSLLGGKLSLTQVLEYGAQIADALDAAHKHGIVHRDLKPGNVMITKSGIKLLDFGLAKTYVSSDNSQGGTGDGTAPPSGSRSPVNTGVDTRLTGRREIVGTLKYMAPEQLNGLAVDARTDIFALGMILFEMLTRQRPFVGDGDSEAATAVLQQEPRSLLALQPTIPVALDRMVRACLAKDPDERWQSAADVKRELLWIAEDLRSPNSGRKSLARRAVRVGLLVGGLAAAVAIGRFGLAPKPHPVTTDTPRESLRFTIPVRAMWSNFSFAVSPDGTKVVFVDENPDGKNQLFLQSLDSFAAVALPGTIDAHAPFWAWNSQSVAYVTGSEMHAVDVAGAMPRVLCRMTSTSVFGTWNAAGTILFSDGGGHLFTLPAAGGTPQLAFEDDRLGFHPVFLPDGKRFLFTITGRDPGVYLATLGRQDMRKIMDGDSPVFWTDDGHLVYAAGTMVMARSFDSTAATVGGRGVTLASGVDSLAARARAGFSVSRNGVLIYRLGGRERYGFVWRDRGGKVIKAASAPDTWVNFDVVRDGSKVIASRWDDLTSQYQLWLLDLTRNARIPLQSAAETSFDNPIWHPGGEEIVYERDTHTLLRQAVAGGATTTVLEDDKEALYPEDWSRDGHFLALGSRLGGRKGGFVLDLRDTSRRMPFGQDAEHVDEAHFSPDGRWLAYTASYRDNYEIYVITVPPSGKRWQVSTGGGIDARWRGDGKELFYIAPDGALMGVDVQLDDPPKIGQARVLFDSGLRNLTGHTDMFSPAEDGQSFLFLQRTDNVHNKPMHVVMGWQKTLTEP